MPMFKLTFTVDRVTHVNARTIQEAKAEAERKCEQARHGGITMRMHMIEEVVNEPRPD